MTPTTKLFCVFVIALAATQLASAGCETTLHVCVDDKDPCLNKECGAGKVCRVDNCGGCKAVCEASGLLSVMTMPQELLTSGSDCPPGVKQFQCLLDPCVEKTCPVGFQCQPSYCGGCNWLCVHQLPKDLKLPSDVKLPSLPNLTQPDFKLPNLTKSEVYLPNYTLPEVKLPKKVCALGSLFNIETSKCEPCPVNTFAVVLACLPCPVGQTTRGKTGQTVCAK